MVVLAAPSSTCCIKTVEHTGSARGTVEKIAGIDTYIACPTDAEDTKKIILYFSDVYGPMFLNAQLVMDYWASNGYLVLALDYFVGDSISKHVSKPGFQVSEWVEPKVAQANEMVPRWLEAVKEQYGTPDTKWVAAGYCFGAPFVLDCVAYDWISAAFAHPVFLDEEHFRRARKPLLLSCSEDDYAFPSEKRRRAVDILVENKTTYHVQVFSGVAHGFAMWGNLREPVAKWAKETSARSILSWFDLFCA
ncbi:Alpha/Beta hydrolase protein [Sparassis latifolia]